jgi:dihydroorotase-like cyclic amidohydrolase
MNSAKDLDCLIMQHAEDYHLSKNGLINSGIIATKLGLSGIPDIAERIIIERDLALLEKINVDIIYLNFHLQNQLMLLRKEKMILNSLVVYL